MKLLSTSKYLWAIALTISATSASAEPWKFGVMSDTQWTTGADPAGQNPTTVAKSIIDQINPEFIAARVKFVIQVGDLADTGNDADEIVRADAAQALYKAGIGFFPMRGNHETYGTDNQFAIPIFQKIYPQTRGLDHTFGAINFSSPTSVSTELDGMTYSFDYRNARFVVIDPWVTPSVDISAAGYDFGYSITQQQPWISNRLDLNCRRPDHAFVFSHQPLMAEDHQDTMFQGYTNANPDMQNAFFASLQNNDVKYFVAGHDHMNQHSIIASPDGLSSVHELIGASDSSKFYTPKSLTDANWFGQKSRETPVSQELYTVGYYIFTVDGPRVTVDFYSDDHGHWQSDANYPLGAGLADTNITPVFHFVKKQTWGYSLNGQEFLIPPGGSYTVIADEFEGTRASILDGINSATITDYDSRQFTQAVDTGWDRRECGSASATLSLWGMSSITTSAQEADQFVLEMSYDRDDGHSTYGSGDFGIQTRDASGHWVPASTVTGARAQFVMGRWQPWYVLGTYGIDPITRTAWVVTNQQGEFRVASFDDRLMQNVCRLENRR